MWCQQNTKQHNVDALFYFIIALFMQKFFFNALVYANQIAFYMFIECLYIPYGFIFYFDVKWCGTKRETVKVVISKHHFIVLSMEMTRMAYFMSTDIPLQAVNHKFHNNIWINEELVNLPLNKPSINAFKNKTIFAPPAFFDLTTIVWHSIISMLSSPEYLKYMYTHIVLVSHYVCCMSRFYLCFTHWLFWMFVNVCEWTLIVNLFEKRN